MKSFSLCFFGLAISFSCLAQDIKYYNKKGVALNGYDAVAYFINNSAMAGNDAYVIDWDGAKWKFNSQANVDSFIKSPEKYAPQYGGYCAYGCSENYKAPTDPNAFSIIDGKLYLNYSLKVKDMWMKDYVNKIKIADINWALLKNQ